MARITHFVAKLPIFSNLRRMMSCRIFSSSGAYCTLCTKFVQDDQKGP